MSDLSPGCVGKLFVLYHASSHMMHNSTDHAPFLELFLTSILFNLEEGLVDVGISEERKYWEKLQAAFLIPYDEHVLEVCKQQVFQIRNGSLLIFSLVNILWFIVDYGVLLRFNPLGFASLTLFTAVVIVQFVAMLYHRLLTIVYELSRATFIPRFTGETRQREMASLLDGDHVA